MGEPIDLIELMIREINPPELEAVVEEWIRKLYQGTDGKPSLRQTYSWLRAIFRSGGAREADIDELVDETLFKYIVPIKSELFAAVAGHYVRDEDTLMPAIRYVAKELGRRVREVEEECVEEDKHQELLDRYFGTDQLTQEDIEEDWRRDQVLAEVGYPLPYAPGSRPVPGTPIDPERLAYKSPKALLKSIATNLLRDYLRRIKTEPNLISDPDLEARDESADADPEAPVREREMHSRLLAALRELPEKQRAAVIACRDLSLISDEEAETLLQPTLDHIQAKRVAKERPISGEDATRLFGRDVSSDTTKAIRKLRELLSATKPSVFG